MDGLSAPGSNACAGLTPEDQETLRRAAVELLDARGVIMMVTEAVGHALDSVGGSIADFVEKKFGVDLKGKAEAIVETTLWKVQSGVVFGMDDTSDTERWGWFHQLVAVASGATAGFVGAPGLLWDIPVTTGMIMRSVADIARSYPGENLASDETKRACIEVFAFGGPEAEDDDADTGYWLVRSGANHMAIELLIKTVAARFGVTLGEKALAQAIPIAGLLAGGGLNYAFMDYYQQMARVHFAIRDVERRSADSSAVRACFSHQVQAVKLGRKINKSKAAAA